MPGKRGSVARLKAAQAKAKQNRHAKTKSNPMVDHRKPSSKGASKGEGGSAGQPKELVAIRSVSRLAVPSSGGSDQENPRPNKAHVTDDAISELPWWQNPVVVNIVVSILCVPAIVMSILYFVPILLWTAQNATLVFFVGIFVKFLSRIIYAFVFAPVGTGHKFASALMCNEICEQSGCMQGAVLASALYGVFGALTETLALVYHREFSAAPKGSEQSSLMNSVRERIAEYREGQKSNSAYARFLEVFALQNATGMNDTVLLWYYAILTDYSWQVFGLATLVSNMTLGMLKNIFWMVALTSTANVIQSIEAAGNQTKSPMDVLDLITDEVTSDPTRKMLFFAVGAMGALFCAYKVLGLFYSCFKKRIDACLDPVLEKLGFEPWGEDNNVGSRRAKAQSIELSESSRGSDFSA